MSTLFPIHVVPMEPTTRKDHRASNICWCGPVVWGRDLATGAPVIRHRTPPAPPKAEPER